MCFINLVKSILVIKDVTKLISEFSGVSVNSINAIRLEISRAGKVTSPANKKKRKKPILDLHCDEFVKSAVRRKVHQFYVNNEPPTVSKVLLAVNSDSDLPNFKRTSFYTLLCDIGFQYVKRNRKNILIDHEDIILWQRDYLR